MTMTTTTMHPSAETFQLDKSQINRYIDEIIAVIFDKVEQDSGYKFSSKGIAYLRKRHSVAFHGWCFQRTGVNRYTYDEDTRRFCDRMKAYDYGGEFKGVLHRDPKEDRRPQTTLEARPIIETNVDNTIAPALYRLVERNFGADTTRSPVAYWRQRAMEAIYRLDDDQFASSRMLVDNYAGQGFS